MSDNIENNVASSKLRGIHKQEQYSSDKVESNDATSIILQQQLLLSQMQQNQPQSEDVDFNEIFRTVWAGKLTVIAISFLFAALSIFFALSKPNIYKASAILAPVSSEGSAGGLASLAGQFGGLASMAGINLGGSGGDKTAIALETIKSRSFIENFIEKHNLLVPIIAAKNWDMISDTLILDDELYDQTANEWIRDVKPPKKVSPSSWEAFSEFSKLLTINQDKTTGIVTIEIEYFSPVLAKAWLNFLIADINEFMREQDQKEAKDSIDYLTNQLENIQVTTMETVFYQLIEEQTKNMMLTQVKSEYVLKTIDSAQVPDEKAKPNRALIVILGTVLGFFLSVLITLTRYYSHKKSINISENVK